MFCLNCGKALDNNAKFCPYCGTVITADVSRFAPAADPASASCGKTGTSGSNLDPWRPKPRGWSKILIGAVAAAFVVVLAAVLIVSGVFSSDKDRVSRAAVKTISAFSGAARDAGLPDLNGLIEGQKFSQSGEIALEGIDLGWYGYFFDVSALEGTGVRFSANYDLSGEELSASVTPFYGSVDLLTAELVMDGSKVYVHSPELTGSTYYGLDTMTLGRDLQNLGADRDEVGGLSFNIFQLVKDMREITETDSESQKAIADAGKELYKAIEVEKTGTETVKVNGNSVKCDAYTVVIPEDAMKDCLRAVRSAVSSSADYRRDLIELFSSIGLPDEMMDEIENGLYETDPKESVKDVFNALIDAVDELGDVELQVYISRGYIMAVTYSHWIEDTKIKVELNLGGGKNYVDDLRLSVSADNYAETEIVLTSHGSHSAKNGTFTDETVLEITQYGYTAEVSSEMSYAPEKGQNNFSWSIGFEGGRIDMEGQLTTGKNSMELHLEELKLRAGDMSVTLRVNYSIGPYQGIPSVESSVMVLTLDEDELRDIADEISDNATDWAYALIDRIPELDNLFGSGGTAYPYA